MNLFYMFWEEGDFREMSFFSTKEQRDENFLSAVNEKVENYNDERPNSEIILEFETISDVLAHRWDDYREICECEEINPYLGEYDLSELKKGERK